MERTASLVLLCCCVAVLPCCRVAVLWLLFQGDLPCYVCAMPERTSPRRARRQQGAAASQALVPPPPAVKVGSDAGEEPEEEGSGSFGVLTSGFCNLEASRSLNSLDTKAVVVAISVQKKCNELLGRVVTQAA